MIWRHGTENIGCICGGGDTLAEVADFHSEMYRIGAFSPSLCFCMPVPPL